MTFRRFIIRCSNDCFVQAHPKAEWIEYVLVRDPNAATRYSERAARDLIAGELKDQYTGCWHMDPEDRPIRRVPYR